MALVPSRANVLVAGVSTWKIKNTSGGDTAYHSLPFLRQGKINIDSLSTKNSLGQDVPYAYELKGVAQFPAIRTEANFVDLMDTIASVLIDHKITLINGQIIASAATSMSPTGFGVGLKIVSDKDMDGDMYVEMTISRRLTPAEYVLIMTTAGAPADGTGVADTLVLLDSLVRADIVPAGISKVEFGVASAGTYLDDIDNLRNAKFSMELLTTNDSRGRALGYAWKTDLSLEALETLEAENLKWPAIAVRANEARITFINGMVATFPTQLGITQSYASEKDSDDVAVLKITGSGIITNASGVFEGIWS